MSRLCCLAALALAVVLGAARADDPKPAAPAKGTLPANFGKLGLTDSQKAEVQKVRGQYRAQIAELQAKVKALQAEEREALAKVLTEAQRARLREIVAEKAGATDAKPAPKPPAKP
jgi:hypothetical protein